MEKYDNLIHDIMNGIIGNLNSKHSLSLSIIICNTNYEVIYLNDSSNYCSLLDFKHIIQEYLSYKKDFSEINVDDNSLLYTIAPIQQTSGQYMYFCITVSSNTNDINTLNILTKLMVEAIGSNTKVHRIRDEFSINLSPNIDIQLNMKEVNILDMLCTGMKDTDIASELFISYPTVRKIITQLFDKFSANNRSELVYRYLLNKLSININH